MVRIKTESSDLLKRYVTAKKNARQATEHLAEVEAELVATMEASQRKTLTGSGYKVTYVRGTTVQVDESGLKKALGAKTYNKLLKHSLDRSLLEKAVEAKEVDAETVAKFLSESHKKAFLRMSEAKDED